MLLVLIALFIGLAAILALLKVVGVIHLSWLVLGKVVGYPAGFFLVILLLVLLLITFFRIGRTLADRAERHGE